MARRGNNSMNTHATIELGMFYYLSESSIESLHKLGFCCSYDTIKTILDGLVKQENDRIVEDLRRKARAEDEVLIIFVDNYNRVTFRSRFSGNKCFTTNIPSLTVLAFSSSLSSNPDILPSSPANDSHDYSNICLNEGISVPHGIELVRDTECTTYSVKDFIVAPSLAAQSSLKEDIERILIDQFLTEIVNLDCKEVILVADPEFTLIFNRIQQENPNKVKNLILFPAIFHARKHLLECSYSELFFYTLLWQPVISDCMQFSVDKRFKSVIHRIETLKNPWKWRKIYLFLQNRDRMPAQMLWKELNNLGTKKILTRTKTTQEE
jgi:hypothetical protein